MSRVRGGQVFVEIGADPARLFKSLNDLNKHIGKIGSQLQGLGTRLTGFGAALAAPIGLAARQFASFDDVLRNVQASTGATTAQLEQIRKASMAVSEAMGIGPTEIAQGFLELLKAGMSLEQVLGGAGQAAIAFGKVGGLAVADAAVVMADAMNVFRVSGDVAANTLSAAADASSTSIEGIAQAFAQASAVAGLANQSIQDTAASLAILANAGIKGSDAGTSLKTMLMRLMAPAEDAVGALDQLGLSAQSFRGADGQMRPMVEIIRTLTGAMAGMDQAAKDDVFRRIFGQDAIRAAAVMTATGVDGFTAMRDSMAEALPVGEKFAQLSGGLSGAATGLSAALQRLGILIGQLLAPAMGEVVGFLRNATVAVTDYIKQNASMVSGIAKAAAVALVAGAAITGLGLATQGLSFALGGAIKAAAMIVLPLTTIVATAVSLTTSFVAAIASVTAYATASIAAATATAAAWGLANVPLAALLAALIAIGGMVAGVGASLVEAAGSAATAIGGSLVTAGRNAIGVLQEMGEIGSAAVQGIFAALNAGDMQSAMGIAMAGLKAAFTVGASAFMNEVDAWGVNMVNAFDFYISQIPFLRFLGQDHYEFSVFGDSTQQTNADQRADQRFGDLRTRQEDRRRRVGETTAAFDQTLADSALTNRLRGEAGRLQDSLAAVKTQEGLTALGFELMDLQESGKLQAEEVAKLQQSFAAANDRVLNAIGAPAGRNNAGMAGDVGLAGVAGLDGATPPTQSDGSAIAGGLSVFEQQAQDVIKRLGETWDVTQMRDAAGEGLALIQTKAVNRDVASQIESAIEAAGMALDPARFRQESQTPAEVVGTFSGAALGQMGFGQNLAQRQLDEQKKTNQILNERLRVAIAAP